MFGWAGAVGPSYLVARPHTEITTVVVAGCATNHTSVKRGYRPHEHSLNAHVSKHWESYEQLMVFTDKGDPLITY